MIRPLHCEASELGIIAQEALTEAVRRALLQHERLDNPVAVWRNGRVEWITASESLAQFNKPEEQAEVEQAYPAERTSRHR